MKNTKINNMSIPTAEEILKPYHDDGMIENTEYCVVKFSDAEKAMIEFAKLHVQAALEAAFKNGKTLGITASNSVTYWSKIDEKSILNAYPLTNIK